MSLPNSIAQVGKNPSSIPLSDSAMVPGVRCHLALRSPISEQPSADELALISGVLPELIEQLLFDADVDYKE